MKYKTIIIFIVIIILSLFLIPKILYPKKYNEYVEQYSKEYNIDSALIYAIIKNESNFKSDSKSNKNAIGLMQILNSTGNEISNKLDIEYKEETMLLEPQYNIMFGTKYLSDLINYYDNLYLAIAAYNAGMGNVDKWIKEGILNSDGSNIENIPFKETNIYVRKVLRSYKIYQKI